MADHNKLGVRGEQLAEEHLKKKGYSILDLNWRSGKNELDIVARIADTAVFVEVKTRSTAFFGDPSEAVSIGKQRRVIQAANDYLEQHELDLEARFDVISIVNSGNELTLEHVEDAFYPLA
ncbi:MAG: YraN family protein [Flavobacteriales bacterium]|nr:YraN family protein [Flavobacteriales bacterium]